MFVALFPLGVGAQTTGQSSAADFLWMSPDGGLRFGTPAGWVREQLPRGSDFVLGVSKKVPSATIHCNMTFKVFAAAQPGVTQAFINARLLEGADAITMHEKRVKMVGGITIMDGFLPMERRLQIIMKAMYVQGGKMHDIDVTCIRTGAPPDLSTEDLKTARQFFDSISVTP